MSLDLAFKAAECSSNTWFYSSTRATETYLLATDLVCDGGTPGAVFSPLHVYKLIMSSQQKQIPSYTCIQTAFRQAHSIVLDNVCHKMKARFS